MAKSFQIPLTHCCQGQSCLTLAIKRSLAAQHGTAESDREVVGLVPAAKNIQLKVSEVFL